MKIIPLTQGKSTIVDDQDYEWAMQWKWYALKKPTKSGDLWYAVRNGKKKNAHRPAILLHRQIAIRSGLPHSPLYDHQDGNGLNNQRSNIRPCTVSQNIANKRKTTGCTSSLKGVSWNRDKAKWVAQIASGGKVKYLGQFSTEQAAHAAYAEAAQKYFGEFARP